MPGKGWGAVRERVMRNSPYLSMHKSKFEEWSHGEVAYLRVDQRGAVAAEVNNGIARCGGRVFNQQAECFASSSTWFHPTQRYLYVLGFNSEHKKHCMSTLIISAYFITPPASRAARSSMRG